VSEIAAISLHANHVIELWPQDEIVPPRHMQNLYEEVGGSDNKQCTWVDFPEAHHNDTYEVAGPNYWHAILSFFQTHVPLQ
jgi:fermentation-respiration switch protein FrsA (DUF1100 family)